MLISEEWLQNIYQNNEVIVLQWNYETGWNLKGKDNDSELNGIELLENLKEYVISQDVNTYTLFLNKIMNAMKGSEHFESIRTSRCSVAVSILIDKEHTALAKLECLCARDENDAIVDMYLYLCFLSPEEKYRYDLANSITNDRTPMMFIQNSKSLVMKYPERKYALIQFDVAKFKAINEMYGEQVGDELLQFFITSLNCLCDEEQLYVRLTADVFMILTSYNEKQELIDFIEYINRNLLDYKNMKYRLVFGVSYIEDTRGVIRKYGDRAALARQNIKSNAMQLYKFFEEDMKDNILSSKYIEDHMERALANREFVMYLQPKYSIASEKMVGAEALVRWNNPEKGMISPGFFIPQFEANGFVIKLDQYIWEEACMTIHNWIKEGIQPVPISVNVSRKHLINEDFISVLNSLIEKYEIPKQLLELEITETLEQQGINEMINRIKLEGYTLLMDDFGSGYSSLNTLKDTQFDVIKIDRGFLQNFIGSKRGQKIVEHIIQMTKSIGLDVIAEGVETKEQSIFLSDCGCDTAQGFYYAKPMPVAELEKII